MTYSISDFYNLVIKEKVLKKFLKEGTIPTNLQIDNKIQELKKITDGFKNPMLTSLDNFISMDEVSSSSKINSLFESIESDLDVCVLASLDQEKKIADFYDTSFSKIEGYSKKLNKLRNDINSLLIGSKYTDIQDEIFYEKFDSLDMVDQVNSNVNIDLLTGSVSLNPNLTHPVLLSESLDFITVDVQASPYITSTNDVPGLEVQNLIKNNNKIWSRQVYSTQPLSSIYIDLTIRLSADNKGINKLILEPAAFDIKTQVNAEIAYSNDGINWTYPNGEYKKRLVQSCSFLFSEVNAEYWRVRFTKYGNDGFFTGSYVYNFGLKNLSFFSKQFDLSNRINFGEFYSKLILPNKLSKLSLLNFKVCETKPSGTELQYLIAPIDEDKLALISGTNTNSEEVKNFKYYTLDFEDTDNVTLDLLKLSDKTKTDGIKCLALQTFYKDQRKNDFILNYVNTDAVNKSETILLRNKGNNTLYSTRGKEKKIGTYTYGWSFDGFLYSTYLLVENQEGLDINFGPTEIFINGQACTGQKNIPAGIHHIATRQKNWIALDLSTLPASSTTNVDPLYPYNHKYLIEGLGTTLYGQNLNTVIDSRLNPTLLIDVIDPDKKYRTQNSYWGIQATEVPFGEFTLKDKMALDVFAYKIDNTNQERIVVKSSQELGLLENETFSIIAKSYSLKPIKGLIFKAILKTTDTKTTPVLSEYLVKMK